MGQWLWLVAGQWCVNSLQDRTPGRVKPPTLWLTQQLHPLNVAIFVCRLEHIGMGLVGSLLHNSVQLYCEWRGRTFYVHISITQLASCQNLDPRSKLSGSLPPYTKTGFIMHLQSVPWQGKLINKSFCSVSHCTGGAELVSVIAIMWYLSV